MKKEYVEACIERVTESGCWIWMLKAQPGADTIRKIYRLYRTRPKYGAWMCHNCDVKYCVNPWHLYEGDGRTNALDAYRRGQRPSVATLTLVREMRALYGTGGPAQPWTIKALSIRFRMEYKTVHAIVTRKTWPDHDQDR